MMRGRSKSLFHSKSSVVNNKDAAVFNNDNNGIVNKAEDVVGKGLRGAVSSLIRKTTTCNNNNSNKHKVHFEINKNNDRYKKEDDDDKVLIGEEELFGKVIESEDEESSDDESSSSLDSEEEEDGYNTTKAKKKQFSPSSNLLNSFVSKSNTLKSIKQDPHFRQSFRQYSDSLSKWNDRSLLNNEALEKFLKEKENQRSIPILSSSSKVNQYVSTLNYDTVNTLCKAKSNMEDASIKLSSSLSELEPLRKKIEEKTRLMQSEMFSFINLGKKKTSSLSNNNPTSPTSLSSSVRKAKCNSFFESTNK